MAKCPYGNHTPCAACGGFIDPAREHVHHYVTKRGGSIETICRECGYLIFTTAGFLLSACEAYRKATGDQVTAEELISQDRITVAFGQPLPLN